MSISPPKLYFQYIIILFLFVCELVLFSSVVSNPFVGLVPKTMLENNTFPLRNDIDKVDNLRVSPSELDYHLTCTLDGRGECLEYLFEGVSLAFKSIKASITLIQPKKCKDFDSLSIFPVRIFLRNYEVELNENFAEDRDEPSKKSHKKVIRSIDITSLLRSSIISAMYVPLNEKTFWDISIKNIHPNAQCEFNVSLDLSLVSLPGLFGEEEHRFPMLTNVYPTFINTLYEEPSLLLFQHSSKEDAEAVSWNMKVSIRDIGISCDAELTDLDQPDASSQFLENVDVPKDILDQYNLESVTDLSAWRLVPKYRGFFGICIHLLDKSNPPPPPTLNPSPDSNNIHTPTAIDSSISKDNYNKSNSAKEMSVFTGLLRLYGGNPSYFEILQNENTDQTICVGAPMTLMFHGSNLNASKGGDAVKFVELGEACSSGKPAGGIGIENELIPGDKYNTLSLWHFRLRKFVNVPLKVCYRRYGKGWTEVYDFKDDWMIADPKDPTKVIHIPIPVDPKTNTVCPSAHAPTAKSPWVHGKAIRMIVNRSISLAQNKKMRKNTDKGRSGISITFDQRLEAFLCVPPELFSFSLLKDISADETEVWIEFLCDVYQPTGEAVCDSTERMNFVLEEFLTRPNYLSSILGVTSVSLISKSVFITRTSQQQNTIHPITIFLILFMIISVILLFRELFSSLFLKRFLFFDRTTFGATIEEDFEDATNGNFRNANQKSWNRIPLNGETKEDFESNIGLNTTENPINNSIAISLEKNIEDSSDNFISKQGVSDGSKINPRIWPEVVKKLKECDVLENNINNFIDLTPDSRLTNGNEDNP